MKTTARTLGVIASNAFDAAVRESGLTNTAIGEALDCVESRVRKFRSDDPGDADVTPSLRHLLTLPWEVYQPLLAALHSARVGIHGTPQTKTLEARAAEQLMAEARLLGEIGSALTDGVIDPTEAARLEREIRVGRESEDLLLAALKSRMEKRK